jgi:parallel beta-helix repeat protein
VKLCISRKGAKGNQEAQKYELCFSAMERTIPMLFRRLLRRPARTARQATYRPQVEALEARTVLASPPLSTVVVHPGESIQAAVDAAQPGTEILLAPGTYFQTVVVSTPNITLAGLTGPHGEGAAIQNPGGADDGITVTPTAGGFTLANLTVRDFNVDGVILEGVNGFTLSHITAQDDGQYGLFPVFSSFGMINGCTASGHRDTGIYVGQSAYVTVAHSRTFDNVNGIEIENSSHISVVGNEAFNNTAGILVDLLPGLDVTTSSDIFIAGNFVHDNNRPNDGDPGSLESFVPAGTGILVLGADHVTITENRVTGNDFVGIGVASTLLLGELAGLPPSAFAGIDPNPDGTQVVSNYVVGNGSSSPLPGIPGADLLWDGSGTGNFWLGNTFQTSVPGILPGGG